MVNEISPNQLEVSPNQLGVSPNQLDNQQSDVLKATCKNNQEDVIPLSCHQSERGELESGQSEPKIALVEIKKTNEMVIWKTIILFIVVWCGSFAIAIYLFTKMENLRRYVIQDLLPIKEIEDLEQITQELQRYQSRYQSMSEKRFGVRSTLKTVANTTAAGTKQSTTLYTATKFERCQPVSNIAFIKTHKTASSTVSNILNRYADLSELLVVLPVMGYTRFMWPRKFHWSSVDLLRLDGQPANILCNHARYDREQMDMVMEHDTKYITILRDPVTQFESSFYYFQFHKLLKLKSANPIQEFLTFPDEHLYNRTLLLGDLPDDLNLIQNGMFYDLGYDFIDLEDDDVIMSTLRKLEKELQLVMIMEYFDESLVLLKHEFCLDLDDLIYIKHNQRIRKQSQLSVETTDRIKQWNRADVLLYQHFNKTFWDKVSKLGKSFWNDVEELKERNKRFKAVCSPSQIMMKGYHIDTDIELSVMNPNVDRYNRYLCEKVLMTEVDYIRYFRKKFRVDFGYQKMLVAEGLKPLAKTKRLPERLKRITRRRPRYVPMKGFEKKR